MERIVLLEPLLSRLVHVPDPWSDTTLLLFSGPLSHQGTKESILVYLKKRGTNNMSRYGKKIINNDMYSIY